ncbi:response regulator transcription factor [Thermus thermamylovorans]|uniref:Response regulator n=1 Tax=Thermus thermamylovorans TaxID=2509362 RepID=A0A4Q9B6S3_9DEIN|nr:response regulator [Thermus thermamylovorans]TBH21456.1 response regulator [Thermus thermamylovorans]
MRILVVDDEESILIPLEFLLRRAGHEVDLARTGEEALAWLGEGTFDLVVLDLMLPGVDGFAVLQRIKGQSPSPKVLVLTARGREADRAKALALGAEAFMAKPFGTEALLAEIRRLLEEG